MPWPPPLPNDRMWRARCAHASWWVIQTDGEPGEAPVGVCSYGCAVVLASDEPR